MSQKVRIDSVKVEGFVYMDEDRWTRSPDEVMRWLCDGWRGLFNNFRQQREWFGQRHESREPLTQAQYRHSAPYRKALPTSVLQGTQKVETSDWISSLRRIKTIKKGKSSRFKRRHDGLNFRALSSYLVVRRLSKHRGEVVITGQNPSGEYGPGDTLRWSVRIRFRWSQDIRPSTSIAVNWSRGTLSFTNDPLPIKRESTGPIIGIDRGVIHTLATSNGEFLDIPRESPERQTRHKVLQRKLARQDRTNEARGGKAAKFGSKRRQKTLARMAAISAKERNRRHDWIQQTTTKLVREHDVIVLEDLRVRNMTAKGGSRKRGLNQSILRQNWSAFLNTLQYKAKLAGVTVLTVNPAYTSQTCNACGYVARENRESQAVFRCQSCGHEANADINAAKNILANGLGLSLERGDMVRPDSASAMSGSVDEALTSGRAVA